MDDRQMMPHAFQWMRRHIAAPKIALAIAAVQIAVWAFDREPPFEVLGVEPAVVAPGGDVVLVMHVRRDIERGCSAYLTRWIFDGRGVKIDLEGRQHLSAEAIEGLQSRSPDMLVSYVPVPSSAFPGRATLVSDLEYRCNPLQQWWPINVVTHAEFDIVSAK